MKINKPVIRVCIALLLCACLVAGCAGTDLLDALGYYNTQEISAGRSDDRYVYQTLSEQSRHTYDQMLEAIMNMQGSVRLSTQDQEEVQSCYEAICADYGEIFWVGSCATRVVSLFGFPLTMYFDVDYTLTPQQVEEYQAQMQPKINEYLELLNACGSDYEKTELLYKKLIDEVGYDARAENNQNILSVFLGKSTVCQGYACAAQYLLQQAGLQCAVVTGTAHGEAHAWNLVRLDGDYYYLDVTWGNTSYREAEKLGDEAFDGVNFAYLNLTTEELLRTHEPQVAFELPVCVSTADSYFVRHDLYFDHWDVDAVGERIAQAYDDGAHSISLKFSDRAGLDAACGYLIDERHFRDYCTGIDTICYMADTDLFILNVTVQPAPFEEASDGVFPLLRS